jgi:hypothetical protein
MNLNRYTYVIVSLLASLLTTAAQAGRDVGSGGIVVKCLNADEVPISSELLDFYEARALLNLPVRDDLLVLEQQAFILTSLRALFVFDPSRALRLAGWYSDFFNESSFLQDIALTDTNDADNVAVPDGCILQQTAIQKEPLFPEEKRYYLSQSVWNYLSEKDRAGLILHELIYRDAIALGQTNSRRTRLFLGLLTSNLFLNLEQKSYEDRLARISFGSVQKVDTPWLALNEKYMWRTVTDRENRNGSSAIKVSIPAPISSGIQFDFSGEIGRLQGAGGKYVGFAFAVAPVIKSEHIAEQSSVKTDITSFRFEVCSNMESQTEPIVKNITMRLTPTLKFLEQFGDLDVELDQVTLQKNIELGSAIDRCVDVQIFVNELDVISRGNLLETVRDVTLQATNVSEIGFGIVRSKQGFDEENTPDSVPFNFSIRNFVIE